MLFYKKEYDYSFKNFFKNGFAKVQIGLAKGKKKFDKRESIKQKDTKRDIDRALKKGR